VQNIRELYHSPNGDRWHLARDPDNGHVFVKHQANLPSGGHTAEIEIGVFLNQGHGLEHQELLRLIGTLVEAAPPRKEAGKQKEICRQRHRDEDRCANAARLGRR
jgi:hypothetical protein